MISEKENTFGSNQIKTAEEERMNMQKGIEDILIWR